MAYEVREIQPKPLFTLHVTDSAGSPARLRIHTGEAVIEPIEADDWSETRFHQPAGFFLPDAAPFDGRGATPILAGEAHLCGVVVDTRTQRRVGHGIADVFAEYRSADEDADASATPDRLQLYLGFRCITHQPIRIGYRVSVLEPLVRAD
jgi:hypothetical protein